MDERWQKLGKTIGDSFRTLWVYIGILSAAVILTVLLILMYVKKSKQQKDDPDRRQGRQLTAVRIAILLLIGVLVLLTAPAVFLFFFQKVNRQKGAQMYAAYDPRRRGLRQIRAAHAGDPPCRGKRKNRLYAGAGAVCIHLRQAPV